MDTFGQRCTLPHEIRGDLDSLRIDVEQYFTKQDVKITRAASEYATDLQKCVIAIEEYEEEHDEEELIIVILGGLSGRLDQTMHTFHVLCQLAKQPATPPNRQKRKKRNLGLDDLEYVQLQRREKAIAISENSVAWLLGKVSEERHENNQSLKAEMGMFRLHRESILSISI